MLVHYLSLLNWISFKQSLACQGEQQQWDQANGNILSHSDSSKYNDSFCSLLLYSASESNEQWWKRCSCCPNRKVLRNCIVGSDHGSVLMTTSQTKIVLFIISRSLHRALSCSSAFRMTSTVLYRTWHMQWSCRDLMQYVYKNQSMCVTVVWTCWTYFNWSITFYFLLDSQILTAGFRASLAHCQATAGHSRGPREIRGAAE